MRPRPVPPDSTATAGHAWFDGRYASGALECVDLRTESARVTAGGFWAVVGDFSGDVRAWRFAVVEPSVRRSAPAGSRGSPKGGSEAATGTDTSWRGSRVGPWTTSMDRDAYMTAVEEIRSGIRAGDVYQANLCRVLEARLDGEPDGTEPPARALAAVLASGNPAPYAGGVHVPAATGLPPIWVVTASPELYLRLDGGLLTSGPIKGTATDPGGLTAKDEAENVMITDLVRNDLQRMCLPGSVEVVELLGLEHHPGLVHLVSTVQGRLPLALVAAPDLWARILDATYPPASVSGAPKLAALSIINTLEPVERGPYCGVVGWIDSDAGRAELAVGIRTFWWEGEDASPAGVLRFGTGAGITWGSDASDEWEETELKAHRLVGLASGAGAPSGARRRR